MKIAYEWLMSDFNIWYEFIGKKDISEIRASGAAREKLSFNTDARDVSIDSTSRILRTARASISLVATNHPELLQRRRGQSLLQMITIFPLTQNHLRIFFLF